MAAAGHLGPAAQVGELALCPVARCADDLGREVGAAGGDRDLLSLLEAGAVLRLAPVEAHRGADRAGRPVEGEEVAELVLREACLDVAVAVRPLAVLLDEPAREPGGRVAEGGRDAVGRGAVEEQMVALRRAPGEPGLDELLLGLAQVREVRRRRQHRDPIEVERRDPLGPLVREGERDRRTPVTALRGVALVAERLHQVAQDRGHPGSVRRRVELVGPAVARQRRGDHVVAGGGEERDHLGELDDASRPAVDDQDREAVSPALAGGPDEVHPVPAPVLPLPKAPADPVEVVVTRPVVAKLAQVAQVDPLLPALGLGPRGPARAREPLAQVRHGRWIDRRLEGFDAVAHSGRSSPRNSRLSMCIATVAERSRMSARLPGRTGSRASIPPPESLTQTQT